MISTSTRTFLLFLLIVFGINSCKAQSDKSFDKGSLYETGMELVRLTVDKAVSKNYMGYLTTHPAILNTIETFTSGNYDVPAHVYQIELSDDKIMQYVSNHGLINSFDSIPDKLKQEIINKFILGIPSLIEGMTNVENLAASSFLTSQLVSVNKELTQNTMLLYDFKDATPIAVVFLKGKNNAFVAVSQPLIEFDLKQLNGFMLNDLLPISEDNDILNRYTP